MCHTEALLNAVFTNIFFIFSSFSRKRHTVKNKLHNWVSRVGAPGDWVPGVPTCQWVSQTSGFLWAGGSLASPNPQCWESPEHHNYPKYTAATKNCLKRSISCSEDPCNVEKTWQRISSLYRSKLRNSKQLALHMGRKVRARRKKMTCWNRLFQRSTKLNAAQGHAIHPQTPNLQRKHTPVNIST